jgi:hypothetical protein
MTTATGPGQRKAEPQAGTKTASIDPDLLAAAEERLIAALMAKDEIALLATIAPDFVGISHAGRIVGRDGYLNVYLRPDLRFEQYQTDATTQLGDSRTGRRVGTVTIRRTGEPGPVAPMSFLSHWRLHDGDWRLTAWQDTPVAAQTAPA